MAQFYGSMQHQSTERNSKSLDSNWGKSLTSGDAFVIHAAQLLEEGAYCFIISSFLEQ